MGFLIPRLSFLAQTAMEGVKEKRKESDSGGGWRKERGTTPKARGASQAEDEHEQRVHGGRLESARATTGMSIDVRRRNPQRRTVNDTRKQTTRDRRGSSHIGKD